MKSFEHLEYMGEVSEFLKCDKAVIGAGLAYKIDSSPSSPPGIPLIVWPNQTRPFASRMLSLVFFTNVY